MANKKQTTKQTATTETKRRNGWKIVSGIFITLFCAFLVLGVIRAYHFKSGFKPATEDQMNLVKDLVTQDLKAHDDNITLYDLHINPRIRHVQRKENTPSVLQASLRKDGITHIYLIDTDAKAIVMHSRTEVYSWMAEEGFRNEHSSNKLTGHFFEMMRGH